MLAKIKYSGCFVYFLGMFTRLLGVFKEYRRHYSRKPLIIQSTSLVSCRQIHTLFKSFRSFYQGVYTRQDVYIISKTLILTKSMT